MYYVVAIDILTQIYLEHIEKEHHYCKTQWIERFSEIAHNPEYFIFQIFSISKTLKTDSHQKVLQVRLLLDFCYTFVND